MLYFELYSLDVPREQYAALVEQNKVLFFVSKISHKIK